RGFPP
ncbi:hypothetical protein D049_0736B, partial [Vibrio parahaemolyticus VPTS-2010]